MSGIDQLAFSPDGQTIAEASGENTGLVGLWHVSNGTSLYAPLDHAHTVTAIHFSPDGQVLVANEYTSLSYWLVQNGTLLQKYDQEIDGLVTTYSPDGQYVYHGRLDGSVWQALNPFRNTIVPNHGGDIGNATIKIISSLDFPLSTGTDVKLTAGGLPDLMPISTHVDSEFVITATFALNGAPLGKRNVVITLPNGTSRTYPQGFTIEKGIAPSLKTEVLGRDKIRGGVWTGYTIQVHNEGNVDASNVDLRIQFPKYFEWQLPTEQAQDVFVGDQNRSFSVNLPTVPAASTVTIPLRVKSPNDPQYAHAMFNVSAWINQPLGARITYVGNLTEALMVRAVRADGMAIDLLGRFNESGIITGIGSIRMTTSDGTISTITLNEDGWPTQALNNFGTGLGILYPTPYLITLNPVDEGISVYHPLPYPLMQPIQPFPPFPPLNPLGGGNFDPCNLAEICYDLDKRNHEMLERLAFLTSMAGHITFESIFQQAEITLATAGFVRVAEAVPHFLVAIVAFLVVAEEWDSHHTFRALGDLLTNLLDCREIFTSHDPNDIVGTKGFGTQQWVSNLQPLPYIVDFENVGSGPAAEIIVTDHLDATKLDMTTVNLQSITFADHIVTPTADLSLPVGQRQFNADVDLITERNLIVHINANLDMLTGDLIWHFTSIDPATGLPLEPDDPNGFLDPGMEGSVLLSVQPKSNLSTGTVVSNKATIVFVPNAPMDTNPAWFNTIDADKPVSRVRADQNSGMALFKISVEAKDVGSGVRDASIYVSDDKGPYTLWTANSAATILYYPGESGHIYSFKSRARDNVLNIEDDHSQADVTVQVHANSTVSGAITLQSCQNAAQTVTLEFRPLDGGGSITRTVALGSTGAFQAVVPSKRYHLAVKGSKWLRNVVDVDARSSVSNVALSLLGGDANNDNSADISDLLILNRAYNTINGDPRWNNAADLNCDGAVDISDLLLLIQNYNTQGMP